MPRDLFTPGETEHIVAHMLNVLQHHFTMYRFGDVWSTDFKMVPSDVRPRERVVLKILTQRFWCVDYCYPILTCIIYYLSLTPVFPSTYSVSLFLYLSSSLFMFTFQVLTQRFWCIDYCCPILMCVFIIYLSLPSFLLPILSIHSYT